MCFFRIMPCDLAIRPKAPLSMTTWLPTRIGAAMPWRRACKRHFCPGAKMSRQIKRNLWQRNSCNLVLLFIIQSRCLRLQLSTSVRTMLKDSCHLRYLFNCHEKIPPRAEKEVAKARTKLIQQLEDWEFSAGAFNYQWFCYRINSLQPQIFPL